MRVLNLKNPYPNGFETDTDPVALEYLENLKEVYSALKAGTLYGQFIDGDRKGSICKLTAPPFVPDPYHDNKTDEPHIGYRSRYWPSDKNSYQFKNEYFHHLTCTWDGRRNKPKISLPDRDVNILLDYDGPTIWEKFDSQAAKDEVLKNPNQEDIDGNILEVGDKVLYINARYGYSMSLDRGTIKEFKVVADSRKTEISTIIESNEGEQSSLSYPERMVWKIS